MVLLYVIAGIVGLAFIIIAPMWLAAHHYIKDVARARGISYEQAAKLIEKNGWMKG